MGGSSGGGKGGGGKSGGGGSAIRPAIQQAPMGGAPGAAMPQLPGTGRMPQIGGRTGGIGPTAPVGVGGKGGAQNPRIPPFSGVRAPMGGGMSPSSIPQMPGLPGSRMSPEMGRMNAPSGQPQIPPPFQGGGGMQGYNPRSVPGGPATGWRPKSLGRIHQEAQLFAKSDSVKNLLENNSYFKKLYQNLPEPLQVKLMQTSHLMKPKIDDAVSGRSSFDSKRGQSPSFDAKPGESYIEPAVTPGLTNYTGPNANYSNMNPILQDQLPNVIQDLRKKGWQPQIAEARRTQQQQADKVAQGYSQTMNSKHLGGNAVDLVDRRYGWDENNIDQIKKFRGDLTNSLQSYPQLQSGANWKGFGELGDWAHIQANENVPMGPIPGEVPMGNPTGAAAKFIAGHEGFSSKPYWDVDKYRYGYGTPAPSQNATIDKQGAQQAMSKWLDKDYNTLKGMDKTGLTDEQWSGLLSFGYNAGIGRAKQVMNYLNKGQTQQAKDYMMGIVNKGSKYEKGLRKRRAQEAQLLFR